MSSSKIFFKMNFKTFHHYLGFITTESSRLRVRIKVHWFTTIGLFFLWPLTRVKLISAYIENRKHSSEDLKEAINRSRWDVIGTCAFHLLPIGITIILLLLNVLEVYSDSISPDISHLNARLNALQFAAKLHEISIGASLSKIGLNLLQYEIMNGGIPLGGFLAGFKINDLGSLWSPEIWATGTCGRKKCFLIALILSFLTLLGATCGPASAILMLPSLGWWEVSVTETLESIARSATTSRPLFMIGANESSLWPEKIGDSNYWPHVCGASNTTDSLSIPEGCPGGGASTMFDWARATGTFSSYGPQHWNITIPIYQSAREQGNRAPKPRPTFNRFLEGVAYPDWRFQSSGYYNWFLSQTISSPAAESLVSIAQTLGSGNDTTRWKLNLSDGSDPPAAQVFAACGDTDWAYQNTTGLVIPGRRVLLRHGGVHYLSADKEAQIPTYDMKLAFPLGEPTRFWYSNASTALDLWNLSQQPVSIWASLKGEGPSIGAAMISCFYDRSGICDSYKSWTYLHITTCSVFARWQPMEIFVDPNLDTFVHSSGVDSPDNSLDKWLRGSSAEFDKQKVQLDVEWANNALPPNQTLIPIVTSFSPTSGGSSPRDSFGVAVTALVADAMARSGMSKAIFLRANFSSQFLTPWGASTWPWIFQDILSFNSSEIDLGSYTPVNIRQWRNGYSYSLHGSTRRLALAILLTHILFALIHSTLLVWIGWSCNILKSLYEVVVLAINSSPTPILENTCAGITRLDSYKHVVKVREVFEQHLSLVLEGEEGHSKSVVAGKRYGYRGLKKDHLKVE
jgi:hypothetical protein